MIEIINVDYDGKKYNYYVRNNENTDYDLDANNVSYASYNDDYDDIYDNGINNSCTSNGKATTPRITNMVLYQMNYSLIIRSP